MGNIQQDMGKTPRKKKSADTGKAEWRGFVDVRLSDDDKERIRDGGPHTPQEAVHSFDYWLQSGYKISLSPDPKHDCVVLTLTARLPTMGDAGLSMSARGPDLLMAAVVMHYKFWQLLDGQGLAAAEHRGDPTRPDIE